MEKGLMGDALGHRQRLAPGRPPARAGSHAGASPLHTGSGSHRHGGLTEEDTICACPPTTRTRNVTATALLSAKFLGSCAVCPRCACEGRKQQTLTPRSGIYNSSGG